MILSASEVIKLYGVPDYSELHGNNLLIKKLDFWIDANVLETAHIAMKAVNTVVSSNSFNSAPKISFNMSDMGLNVFRLEVTLEDGKILNADFVELIISNNGSLDCYALSFVDRLTNRSRWQILLRK